MGRSSEQVILCKAKGEELPLVLWRFQSLDAGIFPRLNEISDTLSDFGGRMSEPAARLLVMMDKEGTKRKKRK